MALTKVSGDFIDAGSITQGHLHSSHGITTTHIAEGDKLFFTNARVDSRIGSLSSSDLSEGTNLYYTDARADARIAAADTGDLSEGTNLYYTQARFNSAFTAKSTSDLSEGTNLYYTDARADARITAADTDSLSEGSTNLYYTDARADARVALIVDSAPSTLDTLNELAAALGDDANFSTTITTSIATKMPLAGGTFSGQVIFPSADTTRPVLPNGFISRNDLSDTSGRHDIWGISERYYPSNSTTADQWGIQWSGTPNDVVFVGGGTDRFTVSLDDGNVTAVGIITATGGNSTQWNTAYGWGDHGAEGYLTTVPNHSAALITTGTLSDDRLSDSAWHNQSLVSVNNAYPFAASHSGTQWQVNGSFPVSYSGNVGAQTISGTAHLISSALGNGNSTFASVFQIGALPSGDDFFMRVRTTSTNWEDFVRLWSSADFSSTNVSQWNTAYGWGNHASAGYFPKGADIGGSANLNDYTTTGYYHQNGNSNATSGSNYPANIAGMLTVTNDGVMIYQTYQGYGANHTYERKYYNGTWYSWHQIYDSGVFTNNSALWNTAYGWGDHGLSAQDKTDIGNLSGTNTGDQDLSGYATSATTLAGYGITNAIQKGVQIASGASWTTATRFGSTGDLSQAAGNHALSVRSENNNDAFMSFHIGSDYAVHFGLDGASNRMHVGGWSDGTGTQYQLYDSRDFSVASVLNSNVTLATLGYTGATNANYITNNNQLTNGASYLTSGNDRNYISDTRSATRAPSYYDDRFAQWDFSQSANFGVTGGDAWAGILTVSKWSSWDASHRQEQLIFSGENLWHRTASSDSAWGTSKKIWDSSNLTNNNQLTNGAGYTTNTGTLVPYIGSTTLGFVSGTGGSTFSANHYSMGVDIANGGWSNPNYSDLIIGYHTGIRLGAAYTGIRFYNNSPTTDTNNTGHGNGGEGLIFTVGGATYGNTNTRVENIGYAGGSFRAPIFYDLNDSTYYTNPASTSNMWQGLFKGKTAGWSLQLGDDNVTRVYNDTARASLVINSTLYPHLYINANSGTSNSNHGGVISMTGNISGGYRRWSMGWPNWNPTVFSMGSYDSNSNPHYGCGGQMGITTWGSRFWFNTSGSGQAHNDWRAPIFYDSNNTGYYVHADNTSNLNILHSGQLRTGGHLIVGANSNVSGSSGTTSGVITFSGDSADSVTHYSIKTTKENYGGNYNKLDLAFHTGIRLGAHANYGGVRFYADQTMATEIFAVGKSGSHVQAANSLRAPLFYDSANTAYYSDPGGTGLLNAVTLNYINYKNSNFRVGDSTTMNAITSGGQNVAFGPEALGACNTGTRNFAYGYAALANLTSGANNIAMGDACGYNVTTGSNNLLFGVAAGRTGYQSPQSIAGVTTHNHQIHMGNESHTTARIQISWTVNSDARDKTDITPIDVGLEFVKQLNPVTYRWDKRSDYEDRTPDGTNKLPELTLGFLAQEVEVVEKSFGYDVANQTNLVVDRIPEQDHYGITYEKMVPILTKAIQEQQTIIDDLKSRLETLENQ